MQKIMEAAKKQIDGLLAEKDMVIMAIDGNAPPARPPWLLYWQRFMTAMYFTWMTFFSVRNSEHQSGLRRSAAMWTMSDSRKKCCFR